MCSNSILIVDNNVLIRKGLVYFLNSLNFNYNFIEIENSIQLPNFLLDNRPEYIFINSEQINSEKTVSALKDYKIIILTDNENYTNNELTIIETIFLSENEEIIRNKIEKNILKISQNKEIDKNEYLSQRETEIVKYVALGFTNQEIADELFLSPHTVITHRKNITKKLGIKTVSGLTVYALLNNIISLNDKPIN